MRNILAIALLAPLLATVLYGQPMKDHRKEMDRGARWMKMLQQLDLDENQEAEIKKLAAATKKSMIEVRSQIQKKRVDMKSLLDSERPDRAEVEKMMRDIANLQVNAKLIGFDMREAVHDILTPEQLEKLDKIRESRKAEFRERLKSRRDGDSQRDGIRHRRMQ
ncbi:MAG: hypothetical protein CL946_06100 [Ectothiorhodospiraceae bacterium]|nr:hypothetical protein [Ectothiorhodospiraceae bacterium]